MLTSLVYLLIAGLLAWWFGPALTAALSLLPIGELTEVVRPRNVAGQDGAFYLGLVLWTAVIYATLRATGLTFLLAGPQSYGNTKLLRRAQGLAFEVFLLATFAVPVIAALVVAGPGRTAILDGMARDRGPAFLEPATGPMQARVEEAERGLARVKSARGGLWLRDKWEGVKDAFRAPEKRGRGRARIAEERADLESSHDALEGERQRASAAMTALVAGYERGDPAAVEQVRAAAWGDLTTSLWRTAALAFKHLWWTALPFAVPLYLALHRRAKDLAARLHGPFVRFLDQGRFGKGGSGRFAGFFEEISLRYRSWQ